MKLYGKQEINGNGPLQRRWPNSLAKAAWQKKLPRSKALSMESLTVFLVLAGVLLTTSTGCSTRLSVAPVNVSEPAKIPPSLLRKCAPYEKATSPDKKDMFRTHIRNMEKARNCASRHNTLVDRLNEEREQK